ncbi:hypothetical protein AAFN85_23495 [Mucilaginibacter sp. CAU 1740]|uniref:hypothetical protein n=1 Tax=Mucilaginibacter sp. CAU 1740 TaxID=3140365 RepID=UPI00325B7F4B
MSKFLTFVLLLLLFTFAVKAQENNPTFVQKYHPLKITSPLKTTVLFKSKFYCLKSNGEVFVVDRRTNTIDSSYTDNAKGLSIVNLFLKNDSLFGVKSTNDTYYLSQAHVWIPLNRKFKTQPIFEDDKFIITATCSGEWGGTIYFKDKKTGKKYEAACTCAVNVIKHRGEYHVTASLNHMAGSTNIFTVKNPLKLQSAYKNKPTPRGYLSNGTPVYNQGDDESSSKKGTTHLIDSIGINSVASFIYNNDLFYIISKYPKTYICRVENKNFVTISQLSDKPMWNLDFGCKIYGDETIFNFENERSSGFVVINQNKITCYVN